MFLCIHESMCTGLPVSCWLIRRENSYRTNRCLVTWAGRHHCDEHVCSGEMERKGASYEMWREVKRRQDGEKQTDMCGLCCHLGQCDAWASAAIEGCVWAHGFTKAGICVDV